MFAQAGLETADHFFVQGDSDIRFAGADIGGAVTLFCRCMKGELADQEDVATPVFYGDVHDTGGVIEYPQVDDLSAKPFDVFHRVGIFDAHQDEQAVFDGLFYLSFYSDGGAAYALDHGSHFLYEDRC